MKTVKEMLTDVRADQAQRQQLEQEQEKKKLDCQQAVALAEKELQDALARQDQEAYHAAEGRLSYAREVLHTFEAADPWWTQEEAQEIVKENIKTFKKQIQSLILSFYTPTKKDGRHLLQGSARRFFCFREDAHRCISTEERRTRMRFIPLRSACFQ